MEADAMATTAMEARGKACLMVLVNPQENPSEKCRPEECSAWSWDDDGNASVNRLGYCLLAGEAARSRPRKKRKIR
jgi:hypothetical protein